ncbi:hypothetical protein E2C01_083675 [Portunus trituberculatus]|uniref:Uncharacterized protein n=1 Tax=Portunus trituberculatus TaxID=210409 RepID=A0A5B7J1W7_PORTR|nr:hypothetical protein [Portunus trituberculatus]
MYRCETTGLSILASRFPSVMRVISPSKTLASPHASLSDTSPVKDPNCLDTSLNFFYINFCNIRSLRSNFNLWNTTSPLLNLILFSSLKHSCLRQLTVAPSLFPPTFSVLIFIPKQDVASMCATT